MTSPEPLRNAAPPETILRTGTQEEAQNPLYAQLLTDLRAEKQTCRQNRIPRLPTKTPSWQSRKRPDASLKNNWRLRIRTSCSRAQALRRREDRTSSIKSQAAKSDNSTTMAALQYEVQDLTQKLNDKNESLDRERQLLASGRDIRDIVGARNLHIIDVYDTGPEGNTRKSFARAFYTEGKSLIFYAYDLPARGTDDGKFVYAAWGEKNGNKRTVRNLGLLLNDDKGQKRWVLNFSDPKVLAEIDSVFVTLERAGTDSEQPNGKRMLPAYLDSQVNHP